MTERHHRIAAGLRVRLRQTGPIPLDVRLHTAHGQITALFGASGSGKTTVLRAIAGLLTPAEARIECDDEVWADTGRRIAMPAHRRQVGFVFQDGALFPHLTAGEHVEIAALHLPRGLRGPRVREILALVHLEGLAGRRPAELSGGEQRRVGMARALARDPAVLLLDEPFSGLDRRVRDAMQRELLALRERVPIPIVLVSHDFTDVARLADDVVTIAGGRTGEAAAVTSLPAASDPASDGLAREAGVVLDAQVIRHDTARRLTAVAAGELALLVPTLPGAVGARVRLSIQARDVILARERPSAISVHNVVRARVAAIERDAEKGTALVQLRAGATPLLATVTLDALEVLGLAAGGEVYALLKAVAVEAFGA
jgi:molybdate transport system ATP-binding protein